MNQPVFYSPNNWKYTVVTLFDILKKKGDFIDGSFDIEVGKYGEHTLYIRGEISICCENGDISFHLDPFPNGTFIFDVEPLGENGAGNYELAIEILDEMWQLFDSICTKAWNDYQEYFDNNKKEVISEILKAFEETDAENYREFMRIYKPD